MRRQKKIKVHRIYGSLYTALLVGIIKGRSKTQSSEMVLLKEEVKNRLNLAICLRTSEDISFNLEIRIKRL